MRICFIGDSFVNGTGDTQYLGWTGRLCAAAQNQGQDITHYNLGIRRDTSADILYRWQTEAAARLQEGQDGRLVFSFGVNDTTMEEGNPRVSYGKSVENACRIFEEACRQYPVLMIGPPPTADLEQSGRIGRLSQEYSRVCAELGIPYLSVIERLTDAQVWVSEAIAYDGAHPRSEGYSLLAGLVQEWPAWQDWLKS